MAKSAPKKSSGSVKKSVPKKSSKQVKKTSKSVAKKSSKETVKKTSKSVAKKASKETAKKTSKSVAKKASKSVPKKASKSVPKKASKSVPKKASKESAKKASKKSSQDLKSIASKASKQVSTRKSSVRDMSGEALDYEVLTVEQLKNLLRERQLTVGGVKSALIARLVESDKKVQTKKSKKSKKAAERDELEQIVSEYDEFTECDPACGDDKYCNVNTGVCEEPDESKFVLMHNGQKFMGTKSALKGLAGKLNIENVSLHHYKPENVVVESEATKRVTDVSEMIEAAANVSAADEETRQLVNDIRKCLGIN